MAKPILMNRKTTLINSTYRNDSNGYKGFTTIYYTKTTIEKSPHTHTQYSLAPKKLQNYSNFYYVCEYIENNGSELLYRGVCK